MTLFQKKNYSKKDLVRFITCHTVPSPPEELDVTVDSEKSDDESEYEEEILNVIRSDDESSDESDD